MDANKTPPRRWPRRTAIALLVAGALAGGLLWVGGRETTLQALVQKLANASGGAVHVSGARGSLYGAMHLDRIEYRTRERIVTLDQVDVDWSPLQYFSSGIAISKLSAAQAEVRTLAASPPSPMPASLAPPFQLSVGDARLGKLTLDGTPFTAIHLRLHGDAAAWELRDASASTPWGAVAANATVGAGRPFKLEGTASLQAKAARLGVRLAGDLAASRILLQGESGQARGDATLVLAPFDPVPLRSLELKAQGIDPVLFGPGLPHASASAVLNVSVAPSRAVSGKLALANAQAGTLDQHKLPLQSVAATLAGDLAHLRIDDIVLDLGAAGRFHGSGQVSPGGKEPQAELALRTNAFDLHGLHGSLHPTRIAGTLQLAGTPTRQSLTSDLQDGALRLALHATAANGKLVLEQARLDTGKGRASASGQMALEGKQPFELQAALEHFSPAAIGTFGAADLNASATAHGTLGATPVASANITVRPSQLFGQSLSGQVSVEASTSRIARLDAKLALGRNSVQAKGSFGSASDSLVWNVEAPQLTALNPGLAGTATANGVLRGTFAAPRSSFDIDAAGLGWAAKGKPKAGGGIVAQGEAWLDPKTHAPGLHAKGSLRKLDPAAFGSALAGNINGMFEADAQGGAHWHAKTALELQASTLANSPLTGHVRFDAEPQRISGTDVELRLGGNVLAARGSFGAPSEKLDWRIDAPQMAALGADFAGALRASGTLSGSGAAPAIAATLEGSKLRAFGHRVETVRGSASIGAGGAPGDALVNDFSVSGYSGPHGTLDALRFQTNGTRAAHSVRLAARNDAFDASVEFKGGWNGSAWNGTVATLQNKGLHAFTLQAPAALHIAVAPDAGALALVRPREIALNELTLRLPAGNISLQTLEKNGAQWRSKGGAAGVPLTWATQFSPALREALSGDLVLGAQWDIGLQVQDGAPPALAGSARIYREKGDLLAGLDVPVALGLSALEARADVADGALRLRAAMDANRGGHLRFDANAKLVGGRVENDSALTLASSADMPSIAWLAPLTGQPGMELDGALKFALNGGGTVGNPALTGDMQGDRLAVRWIDQGVKLQNGVLRASLSGDQLLLQRLSFDGAQGQATADGSIRFSGGEASMQLKLVADKLEALSRPDRNVMLTGQATLVRDARRFQLDGKFRADRAHVELAPQNRPTLSDDVVVLGRGAATAARQGSGPALAMDLEADLGDEFYLKGMGLDSQLAGVVHIRAVDHRPPRANGSVRVVSGTYAAYGQKLAIERGVLNFTGAYDNPGLNILAVRKRPEGDALSETNVEAGVEVRGTALAPVARLVSTPNVSDSDKLAWLVLGHGIDATAGQEFGVLSAAAGALLGGSGGGLQSRLANSIGIDELGLSQAKGLESTVVTVGKRLSQRAYLSFEQGATSATSLVKLRYKLNPRVTLQFQTGANTALDVLYTWAFD